MEPRYPRITNCGWCMVGWPRIEYQAYVRTLSYLNYQLMSHAGACKDVAIVRRFPRALILDGTN